jgi:hypothetical protein
LDDGELEQGDGSDDPFDGQEEAVSKPASKRKPRGVVARFLAGEGIFMITHGGNPPCERCPKVEAILRRALRKAEVEGERRALNRYLSQERVVTRALAKTDVGKPHEHTFFTDEDGAVHGCRCGKAYSEKGWQP